MSDQRRQRQRLEISRQAVRLFREQGVAATSGEQIAGAAGVSERTLWRYFRSKESCVEPLLTRTIEAFQAVLRSWPPELELAEHLHAAYTFLPDGSRADIEAVLTVVRMTREEPALRAAWLVLHEGAERTVAEVLGEQIGLPPDALEVRIHAASVNAGLRLPPTTSPGPPPGSSASRPWTATANAWPKPSASSPGHRCATRWSRAPL